MKPLCINKLALFKKYHTDHIKIINCPTMIILLNCFKIFSLSLVFNIWISTFGLQYDVVWLSLCLFCLEFVEFLGYSWNYTISYGNAITIFQLPFFHVSVLIISTAPSSSLLLASSAVFSLRLGPFTEFLVSLTVFFSVIFPFHSSLNFLFLWWRLLFFSWEVRVISVLRR